MRNNYFEQIDRFKLIRYLHDLKWEKFPTKRTDIAIFQKFSDDGDVMEQITVPLNDDLIDAKHAMAEAFEILKEMTGLSDSVLAMEIMFPKSDILNFHLENESISAGTYNIDEIVKFYSNAKKLINSAAMDVMNPKIYQTGRACEVSRKFIDNCRFGQTEIGSYQVPVICPDIEIGEQRPLNDYSFSRKVELKILEGIQKIRTTMDDGSFDENMFSNSENIEMSATFLSSVYSLISRPTSKLTIDAHWNTLCHSKVPPIKTVHLRHDYAGRIGDVLSNVKKKLNGKTQYEGRIAEFKATEDPETRKFGFITLKYMDDSDKVQSVRIKLSQDDYRQAIRCHEKGVYVKAYTERIDGQDYENCLNFKIRDDEANDDD